MSFASIKLPSLVMLVLPLLCAVANRNTSFELFVAIAVA